MTSRGRTVRTAAVFAVIGAHTLRNVSTAGYLALYGMAALWAAWAAWRSPWRYRLQDRGALMLLWLSVVGWGALVTAWISGPGAAATGLSRFLFTLPVFFALVAWTRTRAELVRHTGLLVGLFALLSMTLPMQFVTGPVPFFAAPSMRGGEIRYASAVGSLTSIGIIVGCYLVLTQLLRPRWRWPALLLITLPAVASLSKAAVANVLLAWAIVLWLNRRNRAMFGGVVIGVPAVALAAYALVPAIRNRVDTTLLSFGVTTAKAGNRDDVSLAYSIVERMMLLPADNWAALGHLGNAAVYAAGGGFGMADTALVSAEDGLTIMAHNQLFESLAVFGLVGGLLQWGLVLLVVATLVRRHRLTRDPLYGVMALTGVVFCLNSFLANGTLYQPMAGAVLYLLFFVALVRLDDPAPGSQEERWSS